MQRFDPSPRLGLDARRSSRMGNWLPSGIISAQTVGQIDQVAPVYINNPNLLVPLLVIGRESDFHAVGRPSRSRGGWSKPAGFKFCLLIG